MPTQTVKYSNFNLSRKQKNLLANDISNTHSKFTGANTFFAQVIFQKNEKNSHFMGGKLVKTKEIFLNGQIRAGRSLTVKKKLILGLRKILIKNTNLKKDFILIDDIGELWNKGELNKELSGRTKLRELLSLLMEISPRPIGKIEIVPALWGEIYDPFIHDSRVYSIQNIFGVINREARYD